MKVCGPPAKVELAARSSALRTQRQSRRHSPALPSARPTVMFFARGIGLPTRTARPVALIRAARYSWLVSVRGRPTAAP